MPVTPTQAEQLAALAVACRPDRATRWDHPGVVAKIREIAHMDLPDVALAVIRAAADPEARTPGVIPRLDAPHWREVIPVAKAPGVIPRDDWCRCCGKHRLHDVHPDDHEFEHIDAPRATRPPGALKGAYLQALVDVCEDPDDDAAETTDTTEETP